MSLRDRILVRKLASGQRQAYVQAVDQHYERVYAFLYRLTQDTALAEDLTQETFTAAWQSLEKFEGRSAFGTWLHKIALNVYRSYHRRKQPMTVPIDEEWSTSHDPTPDLIERLDAEDLHRRAQEAVDRLPEVYRVAVIMRCYQGLKYREIAELLNVPAGTIKFRLHDAFRKLRMELGEEADDRETDLQPDTAKV